MENSKTVKQLAKESAKRIEEKLGNARDALHSGNMYAYAATKSSLEKEIADHNVMLQRIAFDAIAEKENPFEEFSRVFFYNAVAIDETHDKADKNLVNGINTKSVPKRLNLKQFVKDYEFDSKILTTISETLALLDVRMRNVFKLSHEDFAKESPFWCKTVMAKEEGKTPDSNTQICKKIQTVFDLMGVNGKITNHDMTFLQQCAFVHDAKSKCKVKAVNESKFISLFVDLMNHHVEGTSYDVLAQNQKENKVVLPRPEKKTSAKSTDEKETRKRVSKKSVAA